MPHASPARARRISRRVAAFVALVVVGIASSRFAPEVAARTVPNWLHRWVRTLSGEVAPPATPSDTTTLYGPRVLSLGNATSATFVEKFVVANPQGGYLLRLTNGANGAPRVTGGTIALNGAIVAGPADITALAAGASRDIPVVVAAADTIVANLSGPFGSAISVSLLAVPDAKFTVYGPRTFERDNRAPVTVTESFTLPAGAKLPSYLCIRNGELDGSRRNSSSTVTLNGVQVIGPTDLNQQVAGFLKAVTFQQNNVIQVQMQGSPGSRLTICGMATDSLAPQLTITAPTPSLITRESQTDAVGVVVDQTAVKITVNGQPASVTPGTAGQTSFTAKVTLAAEGPNAIAFSAVDAAGNRTDSSRTVIRDTQAPVVTLNSLPDSATVRADSALTVSGTITDLTKVTANVNGQPVAIDSVSHAFSIRIALANGNNFVTVTATDAAGNATSVVRQVTVDNTPPTLTLTGPAESLITKELVAHVTGTATGNSAVTVTVNGVAATLGAGGALSSDVSIAEGANTLTVVARNAAGLSVTATRHVTRDTQAPALGWTAPTDSTITATSTVSVSGTITDATATTLTVNGVAVPVNATTKAYATTLPLATDGIASITLVATDAAGNTTTQTRTVTRDATPPVLTILAPDSGAVTQAATLLVSGSVSDLTKATVTVNGAPLSVSADGGFSGSVAIAAGANTLTFAAVDAAGNRTQVTRTLVRDNDAPAVTMSSPGDHVLVRTPTVTVSGMITDASTVTATLNGVPLTIAADRSYQSTIALSEGVNTITLVATDAAGNATTTLRTVTLDTTAPVVTVSSPADGTTVPDDNITVSGTATDASPVRVTVNGAPVSLSGGGAFSTSASLVTGSNAITVVATDSAGNVTTASRSVTRQAAVDPNLPPNPRTVAPALNRTVATTQSAATTFLYTGSNPIQTGVAAGTIIPARVSTLRGRVLKPNGTALPGAAVSVLNHPEYGGTKSRADGWYDLVVNGGGKVTLAFGKAGYIGAQRIATAPPQDYGRVDDVVLLTPDTAVTVVQLGAASAAQTARASQVTDEDGTRRAAFIFDAGTSATIKLPDGTTQPATSLSIRLTEFTVGQRGREAMPASLPAASAYTYAVEPTADEAVAVGGVVTFSKPVSAYAENFLGFPVGSKIPLGAYDRSGATWVPQPDGRVVKVLSTSGGVASIDADGDGSPDSDVALTALGFTTDERAQIAANYTPGATLMRTRLFGLYPFDNNGPYKVLGTDPVVVPQPSCVSATRDVIKCDVRVATQSVAIPGTPLSLAYTSARAAGAADRTLHIPVTGSVMPEGLMGAYVHVWVAGQLTEQQYLPAANLSYDYTWDGNDAYGRPVQGNPSVTVEIGHLFPVQYEVAASTAASFGMSCDGAVVNGQTYCQLLPYSPEFTERHSFWRVSTQITKLGGLDAKAQGLGGFDFNVHHQYDPVSRVLYLGDGTTRVADAITPVITTVAGRGLCGLLTDNVKATASCLVYPAGAGTVVAMPDGSFLEPDAAEVRRVRPDGIIEKFAGNGLSPNDFQTGNDRSHNPDGTIVGEGGPATQSYLMQPGAIAVGPDGTVYIADNATPRVVRVTPTGVLTRVLGLESGPQATEGMLAHTAKIDVVTAMTVGLDGALYIALRNDVNRIYRLGADSVLHVIAGTGISGVLGDGGQARQARIGDVTSLAVGVDGSLYIGQDDLYNGGFRRVRRITPDGIITTVAGGGGQGADQATLAADFGFGRVKTIAVAGDGTVYVANDDQIEQVGIDGVVRRFAGENLFQQGDKANRFGGDGGPARRSYLNTVTGISVTADGAVLIADYRNGRIRKVAASLPGFTGGALLVASQDGSELYSFDASGRHLSTVDAHSATYLYQFGYDGSGQILSVRDKDGRSTIVERDAGGRVLALVAPSGQRFPVRVDAEDNLVGVRALGADSVGFAYAANGLVTGTRVGGGPATGAVYDATGRLVSLSDALGGTTTFTPGSSGVRSTVVINGPDGAPSSIVYEQLPTGTRQTSTSIYPGASVVESVSPDGQRVIQYPNGLRHTVTEVGNASGYAGASTLDEVFRLPSGLTKSLRQRLGVEGEDNSNIFDVFARVDTTYVNERPTTIRTDRSENTATRTSPAGRHVVVEYDGSGRPTSIAIPGRASIGATFDLSGRVTDLNVGNRTTTIGYDDLDRVTTFTDPAGRTQRFGYDGAGRMRSRAFAGGRAIAWTYDSLGHVSSVASTGRPNSTMTSNADGNLLSYSSPGLATSALRLAYDSAGRLTTLARGDSALTTITYPGPGPDYSFTSSDGDSLLYHHDPATLNLASVWRRNGASLAYSYDGPLVRSIAWSGATTGSASFLYDPDFRVSEERVNGGSAVTLDYDLDGLITRVGAMALVRSAQNGAISSIALGSSSTRIDYSVQGELDSTRTTIGANSAFAIQLVKDPLGRITQRAESFGGTTTVAAFTYDSAGHLTDVTRNGAPSEHYDYDIAGNRIRALTSAGEVLAAVDSTDKLTSYGSASYRYASTGTLANVATDTDTTRYDYDGWGQLTAASRSNGSQVRYVLDADGRRVAKAINGVVTRRWIYRDFTSLIGELDGAGNLVSRFVYGEAPGAPEYMIRGGTTYRFLKDERQSVRAVVDAATGIVAQNIEYDAFGRVTANTNPGFQPFGFAGGLYDDDTKLTHFGARDYDAATGRWTSRDPLLFDGGDANLFSYASGDPINVVDRGGKALPEMELQAQELEENLAKEETKQVLSQRKRLMKNLCHNAATMTKTYSQWKGTKLSKLLQRHHVFQDADMLEMGLDTYTSGLGLALPLMGGSWLPGSPHDLANKMQAEWRNVLPTSEVARLSLQAAGCAEKDVETIMKAVEDYNDRKTWSVGSGF